MQQESKLNLDAIIATMHGIGYESIRVEEISGDVLLWKERQTGRIIGLDGLQSMQDFIAEKSG